MLQSSSSRVMSSKSGSEWSLSQQRACCLLLGLGNTAAAGHWNAVGGPALLSTLRP